MADSRNISNEQKSIDTCRLMELISSNPETFFQKNSAALRNIAPLPLSEYLYTFLKKKKISIPQLVIDSNLSKSYTYQILAGEKAPGRDILLRLAIALGMTLDETQHLLTIGDAGILYPKVRRDAAIICCILQGFNLRDTDDFLVSVGERSFL